MRKSTGMGFGDSGASGAANIQGQLHVPGLLAGRRKKRQPRFGSALDEYPRGRKPPRDETVGKSQTGSLYVCRPVLNAADIIAWARSQGFPTTLQADDLHVTVAFSRTPVDWSATPPDETPLIVPATRAGQGQRFLVRFGDATVLRFASHDLSARWQEFCAIGASWDHPHYQPHVTISWDAPADLTATASPYLGPIVLGPEQWAPVKENWKDTIVEKLDDPLLKDLGPKAGASDYIDDFVHSANPRFKGKSKEERIRMALGAYYGKMAEAPPEAEVAQWAKQLEKAGARHSRSDRTLIQTMHDHAVALGAQCGDLAKLDDADLKKAQVNDELGLVFGYAIICKVDGQPYYDLNIDHSTGSRVPEHIPEDAMLKAAADFMANSRRGNVMHDGPDSGTYVFAMPWTTDIAKAMGYPAPRVTGLMIAYKPTPEVLAKYKSGELRGFSIEGRRVAIEEHAD